MSDADIELKHIRANAELAVQQLRLASGRDDFGFDETSVEFLDGFIERQRKRTDVSPEFVNKLVSVLGSYLGECIIRSHGGRWTVDEHGWRVGFDQKHAAYPFAKVRKRFANGRDGGDSVHSFFKLTPLVFHALERRVSNHDSPAPPSAQSGWLLRIRRWLNR